MAETFVESHGNTYMPLDSAMLLFAGFLEMENCGGALGVLVAVCHCRSSFASW